MGAKVQEEAEEVVRAAREESDERLSEEAADVLYHLAVLLAGRGLQLADVYEVLNGRRRADLELTPSLEEVRELAREHTLVPLRHTFIADCETPVSAYLKLRGDGPVVPARVGRAGPARGALVVPRLPPARGDPRWSAASTPTRTPRVAEELARYRIAPLEGLPPFAGGAVGMFGYDLVRSAEPSVGEPNPDDIGMPELAVMVTDVLLAFDHLRHEVTVLANVVAEGDVERAYEEAAAAIAEVRERLRGPVPQAGAGRREPPSFTSNLGSDGYAAAVERAKEYIRAGDIYQVVPSQRWSADCPVDAFSIYRGLRAINPSPYMYFLDFEDFEIAGASPEALVTVTGRTVRQRPIAGTRPRADSVEQDLERGRELLADPKERAEHVMLVDLGRNDLGRVCEYGSVTVDELMGVETYSHVMHIVSSVSGTLQPGRLADGRAARLAARRARSPARPRSARCRSSTSSSRWGAARTAAPSATSPTRATSTPASTSAPRS